MPGDDRVGPGFSRASDDGDDLIDTAAQAMTRGEPSAQLRMAVRARIERSQASWPIWGKAALAGAAALLLIVIAGRGLLDQPEAPRPAPQIATVAPARVPEQLERSARPARPARPERSERPGRRIAIDPLVIEPIAMPLMAVTTNSGVMPIEIDDLQIEPLQVQ